MWVRIAVLTLLSAGTAQAQDANAPLSAIDWLSRSVEVPVASPTAPVLPAEPPVTQTGAVPQITVTPLDNPTAGPIGLLPTAITGLPPGLWTGSDSAMIERLIHDRMPESLPALQDLLVTLLLAEAEAPPGAVPANALLLARADKLLDLGHLDSVGALLERAGVEDPEVYRRWFDASLLTGTEDRACEELRNRPALAPTYPARIFCLARNGDWTAAALTLNTARALGDVTDEEDALLSRFLDPAISEGSGPLPPPSRISPLVFLMREAIGEGVPTSGLPLAFAHADLRATSAWRNQIEAAERLARAGAISEQALRTVYLLRTPAASGGVWDRAEALQRFDVALTARDPGAVSAALPAAWAAMQAVRTEVPFARLYAEALASLPLTGEAVSIARVMGLLSPGYEAVALDWDASGAEDMLLKGIARGDVTGIDGADLEVAAAAILAAFNGASVPEAARQHIDGGRLGEALLGAISTLQQGASGDAQAMTDAIATLRAVGLEDAARQISLQYLLLDRPS